MSADFVEPEIVYVEKRELERLRRIEAAARDVDGAWGGEDGEELRWLPETAEILEDLRSVLANPVSDDTEGAG